MRSAACPTPISTGVLGSRPAAVMRGPRSGCWAVQVWPTATSFASQKGGGQVSRHRGELRAPASPVVLTADGDVEVAVAATVRRVMGVEASVAALGLIAVAEHRGRVTARQGARAEHPQPGVVVD